MAPMACIVKISGMRDLERQYRITARSVPEVVGEMERSLSRYGETRRIKFRGRKLSNEAFINAAILHLLGLPNDQQERAISEALRRLEGILGDDTGPGALGGSLPPEPDLGPLGSRIAAPQEPVKKAPKRRNG